MTEIELRQKVVDTASADKTVNISMNASSIVVANTYKAALFG